MDDSVRKGVASAWTGPGKTMGFPYQRTEAVVGLTCDGNETQAYLIFTEQPNLSRAENHDGYKTTWLRVRFD